MMTLSLLETRLYRALRRAHGPIDGWALVDAVWPDDSADLVRLCGLIRYLRPKLVGRARIVFQRHQGYRLVRWSDAPTRQFGGQGESNAVATLSAATVRQIVASTDASPIVAKRLGVGASTVRMIRTGRIWSHLTGIRRTAERSAA